MGLFALCAHILYIIGSTRESIVNRRDVFTRAHDALLFTTKKTENEKYKRNIYCNGAIKWNELSVETRNINKYETFKLNQKKWLQNMLSICLYL